MQSLAALLATLLAAAATVTATPIVEPRQAAKCADWGTGFGGSVLLGPTDANASRCCIYGESIELCCRNDPALATDPYWKNALECSNPYWANADIFGTLYTCNVTPGRICEERCAGVPWLYDTPKGC
ncbi:hypothetical protein PG990_006949 [Apiospora arundinis]